MMTTTMRSLRSYVRLVLEAVGTGSRLDAEEAAALERYRAAQAQLERWDAEHRKKLAFVRAAEVLGLNPDGEAARARLKGDPGLRYDHKVLQTKRTSLVNDVEKARRAYAAYAPLDAGPREPRKSRTDEPEPVNLPDPARAPLARIANIRPNQLCSWDDPRWRAVVSKIPLGFSGAAIAGPGPGEERLARIFGGAVQGSSVSFDLVTQDGRRWEVKGLKDPSDTVRPGAEGRRAFMRTKHRLDGIMRQLRSFSRIVSNAGLAASFDEQESGLVSYVVDFIKDDFEEIVSKGEVTYPRRNALRAALKAAAALKRAWAHVGSDRPIDTTIAMAGGDYVVDKPTYVDVARRVERAVDVRVLSGMEEQEIALTTLRDPAFDDPSRFLDEWFASININAVFQQVDGVFIVTPAGFYLVPRESFRNAFRFVKVSQNQPRFAYAYIGDAQEAASL